MAKEHDDFVSNAQHPQSLRTLASRGDARRYRRGTILIHEGEVGDTLFIVLSGRVKVYCTDSNDKEITFGIFGAGDYFGEMALDGGTRSASVITLEPTVCAVIHRPALMHYIGERPEFAIELLSKVIQRLRMATRDARNLAFIDVLWPDHPADQRHGHATARRTPHDDRTHHAPGDRQPRGLQPRDGQPHSQRPGQRWLPGHRGPSDRAAREVAAALVTTPRQRTARSMVHASHICAGSCTPCTGRIFLT